MENRTLNDSDWQKIGQDKVLQTTVLDDIFKKIVDVQQGDKKSNDIEEGLGTIGETTSMDATTNNIFF